MRSFVTGSHAYGKPRAESDVDLVVLVSAADLERMKTQSDGTLPIPGNDSDPGTAAEDRALTASLRFGKLNVIAVTCPVAFAVWQEGTDALKRQRPVTREFAIDFFRKLRAKRGLRTERDKT